MRKQFWVVLVAIFSALIIGCGGGSSSTSAPAPTPTPTPATVTYTIGGTVSGLNGSLTIKNNAADELVINSSGQFIFATPVAQGGQYNVTITTQPSTQTCTLSDYSGTNVSANVTSILISCADNPPGTTSLSLNTTTLALKTSGSSRNFMVTNTGQDPALSVNITTGPTLPSGTVQSTTCGASLAPGSSCSITITPGPNPSAAAPSAPTPSTLTISGSNTNSLNANVYVLTYGNIYQSGYIFSLDDTTSNTSSVDGKVLAPTDSFASQWSTTNSSIPDTSENSSTPCNGANDGACNTQAIVSFYSTPSSDYAAGVCRLNTSGSYTDWYLPALCEMNALEPFITFGISCTSIDSVQAKLWDVGIGGLQIGKYWTSTTNVSTSSWTSKFSTSEIQVDAKSSSQRVRCARKITN